MITVLDGPMGTALAARGVETPPPAWSAWANARAPEVVAEIHAAYARAGATVHTANTFRTKRRQTGDAWERLARAAVAIARGAVPAGHRVAGSVAPLEDCYRPDLAPRGDVARAEHGALSRVLVDAGVDLILCETFPSPREACVAVDAAARTGVETWVALTAGPDADLMTPAAMAEAARACVEHGARAVLVDCTPPDATLAYVEAIARAGVPFGAYANAGRTDRWSEASVDEYVQHARMWVEVGATIVGSCCGTDARYIAEIHRQFLGEETSLVPRSTM